MYVRYTTYRCPSCNARIGDRIVTSPRVGLEYKKCRSCGHVYRTPNIEWQHMTTGQRRDYFLNKWAVAVIGLFILTAVGAYYSDKSDWKAPVWTIAVGIGCFVPCWLWKLFLVWRSINRTSTLIDQQNLGHVQGLHNLSPSSVVSAQTIQPQSNPVSHAPNKGNGFTLGSKIRLGILFGVAIVFGIVDKQWKTIDESFPQLNKVIHAGAFHHRRRHRLQLGAPTTRPLRTGEPVSRQCEFQ